MFEQAFANTSTNEMTNFDKNGMQKLIKFESETAALRKEMGNELSLKESQLLEMEKTLKLVKYLLKKYPF